MAKYRKKPLVIEAVQITESTFSNAHPNHEHIIGLIYNPVLKQVGIPTLEGTMIGSLGDFIITGVNGEHYPCKPDIFEKTYEKVVESESCFNCTHQDACYSSSEEERSGICEEYKKQEETK